MKQRASEDFGDENRAKMKASKSIKKNKKRLGGGGLSLEAFTNAKSRSNNYNPALVKQKREFYKNAKCVNKYKKSLKQQNEPENHKNAKFINKYNRSLKQQNEPENRLRDVAEAQEDGADNSRDAKNMSMNKNKKRSLNKLRELYEKRHEEEEKTRIQSEEHIKAKQEERERAEAQRRNLRGKMFKKTRSGQPVMKYRIEHLLQSIQGSTS